VPTLWRRARTRNGIDAGGGSYTGRVDDIPGGLPQLAGPVVLVPIKAFTSAKECLAPLLGAADRAALARAMAAHVIAAAAPLPVAVVCDDDEVAAWAGAHGAYVLPEPGRGLNGAVEAGVTRLAGAGAGEVLVVHADLPLAAGIARLSGFDGITLVPDRRDDGTNVICLPARARFRFAYGPGSFARHRAEAAAAGLALRVVREPELEWDVDVPADLPAGLAVGVVSRPRP
jgi:2-phospho-L-lactate/phosphoenolpyruvate guanylyltransferase